ncbi:MAG: lipopolysaccharide transport system permease protein [Acidimicrobiaceae bacterium]
MEGELLELSAAPDSRRRAIRDAIDHGAVLMALARKDFQTRYKRATLGVAWAVAVPVLQAAVMAVVFSKIVKLSGNGNYAPFVMMGIVVWSYVASTLSTGSTAIVDNASLTEKVWFPRCLLPTVPALSNSIGFGISLLVVLALLPFFDVNLGPQLLLLVPATVLLIAFTVALSLVLAALHVYYRDVRYLTQAALLVWIYVTPIIYPQELLGRWSWLLDLNPMTGIVDLFRMATIGSVHDAGRPIIVSVVATLLLLVGALEGYRRHDRLFVDQL